MREVPGEDGCPTFQGDVSLDVMDSGKTFKWGVILDGPFGANFWGVPTEVQDVNSTERHRGFDLTVNSGTQTEHYFLTHCRRLGANKRFPTPGGTASLVFAVWAPNAGEVDVVFGTNSGYDNGGGIDPAMPVVSLSKSADGVWEGASPGTFDRYLSLPYMYRIKNAQGITVYRTDIFSRS